MASGSSCSNPARSSPTSSWRTRSTAPRPRPSRALLEAMQERRVTVMGESHPLPDPFFVLATQNPIELEGTYPLPEAQLDRFLFKLEVHRNGVAVLERIVAAPPDRRRADGRTGARPRRASATLRSRRADLSCRASSSTTSRGWWTRPTPGSRKRRPASSSARVPARRSAWRRPRRARALLGGRLNASFEDVQAVAVPVLQHRIVLDYHARIDGLTAPEVVRALARRKCPRNINRSPPRCSPPSYDPGLCRADGRVPARYGRRTPEPTGIPSCPTPMGSGVGDRDHLAGRPTCRPTGTCRAGSRSRIFPARRTRGMIRGMSRALPQRPHRRDRRVAAPASGIRRDGDLPLLVPLDTSHDGYAYHLFAPSRSRAIAVEGSRGRRCRRRAVTSAGQRPSSGWATRWPSRSGVTSTKEFADRKRELSGSPVQVKLLGADWRALVGFDCLWLTDAEYAALDARPARGHSRLGRSRRDALPQYADARSRLARRPRAATRRRRGAPRIWVCEADALGRRRRAGGRGVFRRRTSRRLRRSAQRPLSRRRRSWAMTGRVGGIPLNAPFLIGFICAVRGARRAGEPLLDRQCATAAPTVLDRRR